MPERYGDRLEHSISVLCIQMKHDHITKSGNHIKIICKNIFWAAILVQVGIIQAFRFYGFVSHL